MWECELCGHTIRRAMNRVPSEKDCRAYRLPNLHLIETVIKGSRRKDRSDWRYTTSSKLNQCGDPRCYVHNHMRVCGGVYLKKASLPTRADYSARMPGKDA